MAHPQKFCDFRQRQQIWLVRILPVSKSTADDGLGIRQDLIDQPPAGKHVSLQVNRSSFVRLRKACLPEDQGSDFQADISGVSQFECFRACIDDEEIGFAQSRASSS